MAQRDLSDLFFRLSRSAFRSRFYLKPKDREYVWTKGMDTVRRHAVISNDGKQTPMRGHPVFLAQHATATCCRGCLWKWHHIPAGTALTPAQQDYVVDVIMTWIEREMKG